MINYEIGFLTSLIQGEVSLWTHFLRDESLQDDSSKNAYQRVGESSLEFT